MRIIEGTARNMGITVGVNMQFFGYMASTIPVVAIGGHIFHHRRPVGRRAACFWRFATRFVNDFVGDVGDYRRRAIFLVNSASNNGCSLTLPIRVLTQFLLRRHLKDIS